MDKDTKWFYLTTGMFGLFGVYIFTDLYTKSKKIKKIHQEEETQKQNKQVRKYSLNESVRNIFDINRKKTLKIVFTGGPCAGKTTAMAFCADLLRDRGFKVYMVPEAATHIALGGGMIDVSSYNPQCQIMFQQHLMRMQINLEDRFTEIANINEYDKPAVLLCDRGVMDGSAYIAQTHWQVLMDDMGFNSVQLRDNRYDAVIHLVTSANGAEKYYNLQNPARYETDLQVALEVDQRLQEAWNGHPYWILIDNSCGFDQKIKRVGEALMHLVGQPTSLTFYKKFLLKSSKLNIDKMTHQQTFQIEDTFIIQSSDFVERRIRRRGQNDSYVYLIFESKNQKDQLIETKRRIRSRDYITLFQSRDQKRNTVKKQKTVFIWKKITYSFEEFLIPEQNFTQCILQTEEKSNEQLTLPDFIKDNIIREITDDPQYMPKYITKKDWVIPKEDRIHMDKE